MSMYGAVLGVNFKLVSLTFKIAGLLLLLYFIVYIMVCIKHKKILLTWWRLDLVEKDIGKLLKILAILVWVAIMALVIGVSLFLWSYLQTRPPGIL